MGGWAIATSNPQHLAVRFGYGALNSAGPQNSPEALIEQLRSADPVPDKLRKLESAPRLMKAAELRQTKGGKRRARQEYERSEYARDVHLRIEAAVTTDRPFYDRLVSFWSNHFTVSTRQRAVRLVAGPYEVEAIRPNIMGKFTDLLQAVELHPAMVAYLNLGKSVGPNSKTGKQKGRGLNENLAREILELHTLGVNGGYTQSDVTNFAKIMTGWTINRDGEVIFVRRSAEPGEKVLLGQEFSGSSGGDDYSQALKMLAAQPSTARFIATKLVRHFIADQPPPQAVSTIEAAFQQSEGNLPDVYQALVNLPDAQAGPNKKARNDFEFVVAALRAAGVPASELQPVDRNGVLKPNLLSAGALAKMRQPMWRAPSPAGWPENAEEWLSPPGLAQRLNWISRVVKYVPDKTAPDFCDRVLGDLASERTRQIINAASNREEGLALVLASPEFNRR